MPSGLPSGDRKLLIVGGILLLLLMAGAWLFSVPQAGGGRGFASSYSRAPGGARAAYLLLEELGYTVRRWQRPPTALPRDEGSASSTVLVLADPFLPPSTEQRQAMAAFVRAGGTVLASGQGAGMFLPGAQRARLAESDFSWNLERKEFPAVLPSPLTRNARRITMESLERWEHGAGQVGLYGDEGGEVVVAYTLGRGRIVWWAASTPLANLGIRDHDNLALFLNALGPPEDAQVLWDEYFHGYRDSLWVYFGRTPAPWFALQLALVTLAVLLTFARRNGPVRPPVTEPRLSPLEFVHTLGDLYHRAGAARTALETSYLQFRSTLARQLRLPGRSSVAALHQSIRQRLGWREPGLYETLQRVEQAVRDPQLESREALRLVQALDHYLELFRLKATSRQEKP